MNNRFLLNSKALAGYLTTASGRRLAFAMFVNNTHIDKPSDTSREGETLGRLCEIIYSTE
jgi:D-alanyl-D-alanine carboxypeptidase/D-alanyl-D-alanine-endopeptidase (penicillin-binding protein 4)